MCGHRQKSMRSSVPHPSVFGDVDKVLPAACGCPRRCHQVVACVHHGRKLLQCREEGGLLTKGLPGSVGTGQYTGEYAVHNNIAARYHTSCLPNSSHLVVNPPAEHKQEVNV